jgi:hypothetical protein
MDVLEARRALLYLPPVVTEGVRAALTTTRDSSPTHPLEQPHPQNSRYTPRCPSVVLWTPCSGVARVRADHQVQRSGTTRKQPANLAVEGTEESLSILADCTPTVRPPPKRS